MPNRMQDSQQKAESPIMRAGFEYLIYPLFVRNLNSASPFHRSVRSLRPGLVCPWVPLLGMGLLCMIDCNLPLMVLLEVKLEVGASSLWAHAFYFVLKKRDLFIYLKVGATEREPERKKNLSAADSVPRWLNS